ncbi:putative ABC transport system ATP-binding protein [Paenibacillus sp. V4I7]|nr:putative ABC transport system ATP-binding protein [Paenibacillus sp. V4I7]
MDPVQVMEMKVMSLIHIEKASKYYTMGEETIKALDDVSLDIDHGEFVAIMGPSGSGKSTLMNIIGCLDVVDKGVYNLDGQAINVLKDSQLAEIRNQKIGFVFQSFNLLPRLSAYENVELPLIYRGMTKREREPYVLQALESVDLLDRRGHLTSELSGGQQQRVAISRALAGDPSIILADEPIGALDSKTGVEILDLLKRLNKQGRTIVLITHDILIAQQAKRIIRFRDGRLYKDV